MNRKNLMTRRFAIVFAVVTIGSILIAAAVFLGIFVFKILPMDSKEDPANLAGNVSALEGVYSDTVKKSRDDLYTGNLILVNNDTEYRLNDESHLGNVFDLRNSSYKAQDKNVRLDKNVITHLNEMMDAFVQATGKTDVMICSGYRNRELQEKLYQDDLAKTGNTTSLFVTKPGFSEHHTGLSFDLGLYPENGFFREYDGTGEYRWISQNCYQYGFVVRYESDKIDITKIGNEPWHIRYVGVPHAYVMKKQDLCLEEYLNYLKDFPYDGKHLMVTDDKNQKYEIYYVAAPAGEKIISVPVPENGNYEISGNNTDGFIVTVSLS